MTNDHIWFTSRPETQEVCRRCNGHGYIIPGYALTWSDEPIRGASDNAVGAIVVGSSSISEATREASDIACRSGRPVAFVFIGHTVEVNPLDRPEVVARRWWHEMYGESPEETAARR